MDVLSFMDVDHILKFHLDYASQYTGSMQIFTIQ